jgi:hypothetical protein
VWSADRSFPFDEAGETRFAASAMRGCYMCHSTGRRSSPSVRGRCFLVFWFRQSVPLMCAKPKSQGLPQELNNNPIFAATALLSRLRFRDLMSNRHFQEYPVVSSGLFWFSFSFPQRITSLSAQNLWTGNIFAGGVPAPFAYR